MAENDDVLDLERVYLALVGGRAVVGKLVQSNDGSVKTLRPAYDFQPNMQPEMAQDPRTGQVGPTGRQSINHMGFPLALMASLSDLGVPLPEDCPLYSDAEVSSADRAALRRAFAQGEKMALEIRSAQAGVSLAAAMPPKNGPRYPSGRR